MNFSIFTRKQQSTLSLDQVDFSSSNAAYEIDSILGVSILNPDLCENALRSISVIASQKSNRTKFLTFGTISKVLQSIEIHSKSIIITEWGIRAVCVLTADEIFIPKFLDFKGCEILSHSIKSFSNLDSIVEQVFLIEQVFCHIIL
jgi:hypothetical protein